MRLRLTHKKIKHVYSSRDVWVGQKWSEETDLWEDATNKYQSALQAEVALLRSVLGEAADLEPTFEHGDDT